MRFVGLIATTGEFLDIVRIANNVNFLLQNCHLHVTIYPHTHSVVDLAAILGDAEADLGGLFEKRGGIWGLGIPRNKLIFLF